MLNDGPPKPCEKSAIGGIGEWNALIECELPRQRWPLPPQ
jgi:hypothetical protein